jgi:hypothetical protein
VIVHIWRRARNIRPHANDARGVAVRAHLSCWAFWSHHFCEERARTESLPALEQLTLKKNRRTLVAFHTVNVHVAFPARCSFQLPTKERSASHVYKSR